MNRATPLLAALVLLPAAAAPARAQASHANPISAAVHAPPRDGAVPASPSPSEPRVAIGYTGIEVGFSASVGPDGALTQSLPVVRAVSAASPGQQAGIAAGDVIVEVNGRDSRTERALWLEPGVRYTLRIRSGDQEREVVVVPLTQRPAAAPAP